MTTLQTVLNAATPITTATAPTLGNINSYNASGGVLAVTLPALSGLNVGASCIVEKSLLDTTLNAVTFTANGTDTFDDGTTSLIVITPGEKRNLQVVSISGIKYWKVTDGFYPKAGLAANIVEVSVTNTTAQTTLISTTLPAGQLVAGATYRIVLNGTIQVQATSGTLTFTPFIQGTALAQTAVMTSSGTAQGPVNFHLEYIITVRSTGATGTAIAKPFAIVQLSTLQYMSSTSAAVTTINTTAAASSNVLSVAAQWATASSTNTLLVETATIERIV